MRPRRRGRRRRPAREEEEEEEEEAELAGQKAGRWSKTMPLLVPTKRNLLSEDKRPTIRPKKQR
jgi:hypothetical protein